MRKIPTLFVREFEYTNESGTPKHGSKFTLTDQVAPGCEWVLSGEGVATRKWDGTCILIQDREVYKRFDAKHGKTPPPGFMPAQEGADPITGHWPGWVPLADYPDKWIQEAVEGSICLLEIQAEGPIGWRGNPIPDGTYEAVGPKINGNRDRVKTHTLYRHGITALPSFDRTFEGISVFLQSNVIEGIVFHHSDGRMSKIKRSDFGLKW
ncbi:DUF5565 family protein [Chitinophaga sp. MM2321]|uniref:RNA ligase 1 family protein n=1 Tax=Chitinophaga sp. MM2321 TaxID=3137178 RepID=UPI0032D582D1